ncbi:MarR family winged helix-turn-helix transcriptional regulator [Amycolatopsis australiensis]|uniref:DNA-binding transcriptional regulator, MarR family n=1 Tax=Amycolatopsis australiensis TaxID=546364 RepID=A0A1K1SSE7_9PSEU|nr:MarR family transcriptional regulator [Amycolatopsis australiensis]SFW86999.1 DNA-binding transcriptional regulator, MarR family [Amycolatopsis australiensis]
MPGNPVEAFDMAFQLAARLGEAMQRALAERDLTPSRAEVIYVLARDGELVQRALAEALGCTPRHVTGLIDQLEGAGFVERRAHPHDRRATAVHLTDDGVATAQWMTKSRHDAARAILGDVSEADLAAFLRVVGLILRGVTA